MTFEIRKIQADDIDQVFNQMAELAKYGEIFHHFKLTKEKMQEDLFGVQADWHGLVAVSNGRVLGSCLYSFANTNRAYHNTKTLFLDGLYINPQQRSKNIGKKLINKIITIAKDHNIHRIELWCLKDNSLARSFYKELGAIELDTLNVHRFNINV